MVISIKMSDDPRASLWAKILHNHHRCPPFDICIYSNMSHLSVGHVMVFVTTSQHISTSQRHPGHHLKPFNSHIYRPHAAVRACLQIHPRWHHSLIKQPTSSPWYNILIVSHICPLYPWSRYGKSIFESCLITQIIDFNGPSIPSPTPVDWLTVHPSSLLGPSFPDGVWYSPHKMGCRMVPPSYEFVSKPPWTILVGGWATPLKNMSSSIGMMRFSIYGKIKNVPNHQPV